MLSLSHTLKTINPTLSYGNLIWVHCSCTVHALRVNSNLIWVHCSCTVWHCSCTVQHCSCTVHVLKNIKNGTHDTIYTFKNYFGTVFSVFSFKFSATISSIQTDPVYIRLCFDILFFIFLLYLYIKMWIWITHLCVSQSKWLIYDSLIRVLVF